MFAIWLMFSKDYSEYFSKIINQLSIRYSSSKFDPHLTVYGVVNVPRKIMEESITSISKLKQFEILNLKISHSPEFWKSIFCEIKPNNELSQISTQLTNHLKEYTAYKFQPHVSLLYKKLKKSDREIIISNLKIKKKFVIDQITIIKFFDKIEKWEIIRSYKLKNRNGTGRI